MCGIVKITFVLIFYSNTEYTRCMQAEKSTNLELPPISELEKVLKRHRIIIEVTDCNGYIDHNDKICVNPLSPCMAETLAHKTLHGYRPGDEQYAEQVAKKIVQDPYYKKWFEDYLMNNGKRISAAGYLGTIM